MIFPDYTGTAWQMMPYVTEDPLGSIPDKALAEFVAELTEDIPWEGVGFLTVDEAIVPAGQSHRTPGLHTDGNPFVNTAWGPGGNNPWVGCYRRESLYVGDPFHGGGSSQYIIASAPGCRLWDRLLQEPVNEQGDCAQYAHLYLDEDARYCLPNIRYELKLGQVHESFALPFERQRQFVRVCPPSNADWPDYYTANPLGVLPQGKVVASA